MRSPRAHVPRVSFSHWHYTVKQPHPQIPLTSGRKIRLSLAARRSIIFPPLLPCQEYHYVSLGICFEIPLVLGDNSLRVHGQDPYTVLHPRPQMGLNSGSKIRLSFDMRKIVISTHLLSSVFEIDSINS